MKYNRLERLEARRTDPLVKEARLLNEVYGRIAQSESVRYAIGAMQPIDPEYTKNTYREGDRVRNQLETNLSMVCEYEYQGSVTNDTHIRARSDIDLLTLTCRYGNLETGHVVNVNFSSNQPIPLQLTIPSQTIVSIDPSTPAGFAKR